MSGLFLNNEFKHAERAARSHAIGQSTTRFVSGTRRAARASRRAARRRAGNARSSSGSSRYIRYKSPARAVSGSSRSLGRVSRRHRMRQPSNSLRKELINALAQVDMLVYFDACQATSVSSQSGIMNGLWFTDNQVSNATGSLVVNPYHPWGSRSPMLMQEVAYQINQGQNQDIAFEQNMFKKVHTITSRSNQRVCVEGWLVEARDNVPNTYPFIYNSGANNILTILGWAMYQNNKTGASANSANAVLPFVEVGLYQYNAFLQYFKVLKQKKHILGPGRTCRYAVSDKTPRLIRPNKFLTSSSTNTTYYTQNLIYRFMRGEKFWIFRVYSEQLGNDATVAGTLCDAGASVNMYTKTQVHYKYVQDNASFMNLYGSGISAAPNVAQVSITNSLTGAKVNEVLS